MGYIRLYSKVIRGEGEVGLRVPGAIAILLGVRFRTDASPRHYPNGRVSIRHYPAIFERYVLFLYEPVAVRSGIENKRFTRNSPINILKEAWLMLYIYVDLLLNTIDNRSK